MKVEVDGEQLMNEKQDKAIDEELLQTADRMVESFQQLAIRKARVEAALRWACKVVTRPFGDGLANGLPQSTEDELWELMQRYIETANQ